MGTAPTFVGGTIYLFTLAFSGYWQNVGMRGWHGSFQGQDKEWQVPQKLSSCEKDSISSSSSGSILRLVASRICELCGNQTDEDCQAAL